MFTIEYNQRLEFQVEFEIAPKEKADKVVSDINSHFIKDRARSQQYKTFARIYVTCTVDDCTPICNIVKDIARLNEVEIKMDED